MIKAFLFFVFSLVTIPLIAQRFRTEFGLNTLLLLTDYRKLVRCMLQIIWVISGWARKPDCKVWWNKMISFPYSPDKPLVSGMGGGCIIWRPDGDIWIGTENLVRFERSTQRLSSTQNRFTWLWIYPVILQDKKGFIWTVRNIKDQNKLNRFDPKRVNGPISTMTRATSLASRQQPSDLKDGLAEDKDGKFWSLRGPKYE